jgi:hypothetical protein
MDENGNIILNWTKYLGDSTLNEKFLVVRDNSENKWYQAELFNNGNNLCLESECCYDAFNNLHMLLGERSENLMQSKSTFKTRLSYFSYSNNSWSGPESVFNPGFKSLRYGFGKVKFLIDKRDAPLFVFISAPDTSSGPKLLMRRKNKAGWSEIKDIVDLPTNFDIFIDTENKYHIAFIKGTGSKNLDVNSVFYCCSNDSGKTFSGPVLVHKSGLLGANDLSFTIDTNSIKHVVFSKSTHQKSYPGAIYHCFSKDGFNWSDTIRISNGLGGNNINPCIVCDSKNNLHVLWEWTPQVFVKPSSILYSRYDGNKWSDPVIVFENATAPVLNIDKEGYIHVACKDISNSDSKTYNTLYARTIKPVTK